MSNEISWSEEAKERLEKAPLFLRPMVKSLTEKKAMQAGLTSITEDFLSEVRDATMTQGDDAMPTIPEPGHKPIVWTKEAVARLEEIPQFTRDITRKIIEEVAVERGHLEVNCKLFSQVEELGETTSKEIREPIAWSDEALKMMDERMAGMPEMAVEFMDDLLRTDVEEMAWERNEKTITAKLLQERWEQPQAIVAWAEDARERLNNAPDFVRSGIKKAAERRALREGLAEIKSGDLTRFRNESMMKAVKRMRAFGFRELTFDGVFEKASSSVKRLKDNPQAVKRFAEIREHVEAKEGGVGLLDSKMVQKMKDYLEE